MQVYDFDVMDEGNYYMVMELIDGCALESKLQDLAINNEIMPLEEAIYITQGVNLSLGQ